MYRLLSWSEGKPDQKKKVVETMNHSFLKSFWREKAQSMIEFALVFPLLLLLIFGIIEFGRMLFIYNAVTTASREAARYGSAVGTTGSVPRYLDCAGIMNAAQRAAIITPINSGNLTIVYDRGAAGTEFATSCEAANDPNLNFKLGDRIKVMVAVNYMPLIPLLNFPVLPISSTTARTILRTIEIIGTPMPPMSTDPYVIFEKESQSGTETELATEENAIWAKLTSTSITNVTVFFSYDDAFCSGTATRGEDYSGLDSVIFPTGVDRMKIAQVIQDPYDEEDETIEVCIVSASGAQIDDANRKHTTTIIDTDTDDPPPQVYFKLTQQNVKERASTLIAAELETKSGKPVTVSFNYSGVATYLEDYTLPDGNIFSFSPGSTIDQVFFTAVWDKLYEGEEGIEDVWLTLINPVNAIVNPANPNSVERVVIEDIDEPPNVSFDLDAQTGIEDEDVPLTLLVILDKPSAVDVVVAFDVTDVEAEMGIDYDVDTSSPVTIPAGSTEAEISIQIFEDLEADPNETFEITMGAVQNATRIEPIKHTVKIIEAFGPPKVRLEVDRGVDEGTGQTLVRVLMDHAWNQGVTVPFTFSDGTAKSPDDYSVVAGVVTIPIGRVYGTILVTIIDDAIDEDNETIHFSIGNPTSGGAILDPDGLKTHTLTIIDNDIGPEVFFAIPASQGMEDGGPITVQLMLSTLSSRDVTINYSAVGSASPGADYSIQASPVMIAAGSLSTTIVVTPVDDQIPTEPNETVIITIGSVTNGSPGIQNVHTVAIKDDDICPSLYSRNIQPNSGMTYMTLGLMYSDLTQPSIYITGVNIEWNNGQGQRLTQVDWIGTPIWSDKNGTTTEPLNITTFSGPQSDRTYDPIPTERMLVVFFKNDIRGVPSDYSMTITFNNGCIVP